MTDYARPVRRAVLPRLKSDGTLTSLVPVASIYPSTVPIDRTFPFIRYGVPTVTPLRATGLSSSSIRVTINAFTKALVAGGATVESAESMAERIGAAIIACLDNCALALEGGMTARLTWLTSVPRADPDEKDAWATSVSFRADVSG